MTINKIIEKFLEDPERMRMGARKLAQRWQVSEDDIRHARYRTRKLGERLIDTKSLPVAKAITSISSPSPYIGGDERNVLITGDLHEPFCKKGYLEFCREMQEKYNCGTVVMIGDLVDNHAVNYHEHDPEGDSAGGEFTKALSRMHRWYYTFPSALVCIGNHDALPFRKLYTAGMPKAWLKNYEDLLEAPKTWKWSFTHQHEGVIYQHGTKLSGEMAAINAARDNRQSTVIGHLHTVCNTRFLASYKDLIFGVTVGCGIDHTAYAFAYGREQTRKPVLACAVVLGGKIPINLPMSY